MLQCQGREIAGHASMVNGAVIQEDSTMKQPIVVHREVVRQGVGFGSALAIVISWTANKSIAWAVIHGLFSWIYVLYYALFK